MEELRMKAFCEHFECTEEEVEIDNYNGCCFNYDDCEYLILTDDEADEEEKRCLENYVEGCLLPELPEWCHRYFNEEEWCKDNKGLYYRPSWIAAYDGHEIEVIIKDNDGDGYNNHFYIYRIN